MLPPYVAVISGLLLLQVFCNSRQNYHTTVFHFSHPTDIRADAQHPASASDLRLPPHERPGPSEQMLSAEKDACRSVVTKVRRGDVCVCVGGDTVVQGGCIVRSCAACYAFASNCSEKRY